ncbi:MAG: glycosyltransferase [Firmicutes bacterium]|nr:glycosyltransferase [Bacillota bacterium]
MAKHKLHVQARRRRTTALSAPPHAIWILYARYGDGHRRAAMAVRAALHELDPQLPLVALDYMGDVVPALDNIVRWSYTNMIKHVPNLWGWMYDRTEEIATHSLLQTRVNHIGLRSLERALQRYQPRAVISTYPVCTGALGELKELGRTNVPLVTVLTDYVMHTQWIHPGTDLYAVGAPEVAAGLIERGVDPGRIRVTGIPVQPSITRLPDTATARRQFGLDPDRPVILVMSGAYGVMGGTLEVCASLAKLDRPIQVVAVCGHNEALREEVTALAQESRVPITALGYTRQAELLMRASDLLITKAGGLTVSEALAIGVPMLIYLPIPGQEEFNTAYVVQHGAGEAVYSREQLVERVVELIDEDGQRKAMAEAARQIGHPRAAYDVANLALDLIEQRQLVAPREA